MVSPTTSTESSASGAFGTPSGPFGDLYVEWSGPPDAPGVVILHGWGSSAEMMRILADALAPTHRVANVDLPGHGRAGIPQKPIGVAGHAERVATLIRERFNSPVSIIGHSNGGRIALFMASDETISPLITSLVLIAPSGVRPRRKPSFYLKKYTAQILKLPFSILPGRLREFGLDWLRHSLVWRALGSSDYRRLSGVMRDTFVKTVTHHLDDRLDDIRVPTLVFRGDLDQDISQYQISVLESRIPDAGVVMLKSAGHYAHLDDPQTVILATRHFLSTPSPGESQE